MDSTIKVERKQNPRRNANPLSLIFFCWTLPTFRKGLKNDLEEEDLYQPLEEHISERLGDKLEAEWQKQLSNKNPSLWKAIGKMFFLEFAAFALILIFTELILKLSQPLALAKLIEYFKADQTTVSKNEAYMYASVIVGASFLNVLFVHNYMLGMQHLGMKIRVACCSLVYRKALKLSKSSLAETTIGQMVNLLSNDVNRFDIATVNLHSLWIAPLEIALIFYLMYLYVGLTSAVGIGFLALFIPLQMYMGKRTSVYRLRTALKTDERVRLMNEIVSGIQVIKMYTWEKPFADLVDKTRRLEIKQIRNSSYIRAIILSISEVNTKTAIFLCILTYVLMGYDLTAEYVFIITGFYNVLRKALTIQLPNGITQYAEATVSIKRLQQFLLYEEIDQIRRENEQNTVNLTKTENGVCNGVVYAPEFNKFVGVSLKQASAEWLSSSTDTVLTNITLDVAQSQLIALIGPVGCGKTSLLHLILKELPLKQGELIVNGQISYASQDPWLFAGTLQQNILFGQPMDLKRYEEVITVCALQRDFSLLPYGDKSLVGERGVTLSGGQRARINLARAIYKEADIYLLDDPLSAVDTHVGKQLFDDCIRTFLSNKCTILVTHQLQYLTNVNKIYLLKSGKVEVSGSYQELQTSGVDFAKQLGIQSAEEEKPDDEKNVSGNNLPVTNSPTEKKELTSKGDIKKYVYTSYLKAGGNWLIISIILFLFLFSQLAKSASDYFVTYWVNLEQKRNESKTNTTTNTPIENENLTTEVCVYIYAAISIALVVSSLVRSFSFFNFCMRASRKLHDLMFSNIVYTAMRFFTLNSSGRILNRFSKDMGGIDENLPTVVIDCLQIGLTTLGVVVIVATVNFWLLIPTVIILFLFYLLRNAYLCTSRSVKRLEGTTRSPVFAHLNASLQGLTTIRAFGAQKILKQEFDIHQDLHSSAWFVFLSSSRAFGFWVDLICALYIAIVTYSFLIVENETFGGNVGLAVTQSVSLTGMFQWGIRQWSELENQMTSVERVVEYTRIPREAKRKIKPKTPWPERGDIEFKSVSLKYSTEDPHVLKKLTFSIEDKEKIGIVGRTGAGKSSLIYALFQLTETEGTILVDNVNISTINLQVLRSSISIIPQEPVLFSGTLRKNLDPFDEYSDLSLWNALEEVELKNAVADLPHGLSIKMSEGGSNFSVGQRQLVCLARAILRKNKILVMDEATANVDPQTDALIQQTIRKKFADCTVLTIAHRLHTVMDSDRVLVMDSGTVVELDEPHVLLQNKQGVFYGMVQQTGKSMMETLLEVANVNHNKKQD